VVKRRTLDEVLTAEQTAFLRTGKAIPQEQNQSKLKPEQEEPPMPRPTPLKENFIQAAPPAQPQKAAQAAQAPQAIAGAGAINARIDPKITTALLRASLERRIEGRTPSTQRDIIAEAVTDWLKKNGYPV
jgi:hypothetical protein